MSRNALPAPPPYGRMPREFYAAMSQRNGFPEKWRGSLKQKAKFLKDTERLMRVVLDVKDPWHLLRQELRFTIRVLNEIERRCKTAEGPMEPTHKQLFREEDGEPFGASLRHYAPWLAARSPVPFTVLFEIAFGVHMGMLDLRLKDVFQRARPYQIAQVLVNAGESEFARLSHFGVRTALSSAFPGGHAYEATIAFAFAFCRLNALGVAIKPEERRALAQYAADIPDRRIMAGLHYPLDSVGSWLLAYQVVPNTFPSAWIPDAQAFIAEVIRRSRVFVLLRAGKATHYGKVYDYLRTQIPGLDARLPS